MRCSAKDSRTLRTRHKHKAANGSSVRRSLTEIVAGSGIQAGFFKQRYDISTISKSVRCSSFTTACMFRNNANALDSTSSVLNGRYSKRDNRIRPRSLHNNFAYSSVSYTHLDVYKRQPDTPVTVVVPVIRRKTLIWLDPITGEAAAPRKSPRQGGFWDAFSELHWLLPYLSDPGDVYKRQLSCCLPRCGRCCLRSRLSLVSPFVPCFSCSPGICRRKPAAGSASKVCLRSICRKAWSAPDVYKRQAC